MRKNRNDSDGDEEDDEENDEEEDEEDDDVEKLIRKRQSWGHQIVLGEEVDHDHRRRAAKTFGARILRILFHNIFFS